MRVLVVGVFLFVVVGAVAQEAEVELCTPAATGPCRPLSLATCWSAADRTCVSPNTIHSARMVPPYDALVRFGGARLGGNGSVLWIWIKAGEASRRCTEAERRIGDAHARACDAKIGDELYQTHAFKLKR